MDDSVDQRVDRVEQNRVLDVRPAQANWIPGQSSDADRSASVAGSQAECEPKNKRSSDNLNPGHRAGQSSSMAAGFQPSQAAGHEALTAAGPAPSQATSQATQPAARRALEPAAERCEASQAAGYQPSQAAGYQPSQAAGYQPSQAAGYQPSQAAGYQPSQAAGYQPSQAAGYQPSQAAGDLQVHRSSFFMSRFVPPVQPLLYNPSMYPVFSMMPYSMDCYSCTPYYQYFMLDHHSWAELHQSSPYSRYPNANQSVQGGLNTRLVYLPADPTAQTGASRQIVERNAFPPGVSQQVIGNSRATPEPLSLPQPLPLPQPVTAEETEIDIVGL